MCTLGKAPPANPAFELMVSHLVAVTVDLFAGHDIRVQACASVSLPTPGPTLNRVTIGYMGDDVRGALTLVAAESTVQAWLGAPGPEPWDLPDALGEYSNMLLGRLKARLAREGLPFLLATPTSASGCGCRLSTPPGQSTWLAFDGPGWQVALRLDAKFELDFVLQASANSERPLDAGEALLF